MTISGINRYKISDNDITSFVFIMNDNIYWFGLYGSEANFDDNIKGIEQILSAWLKSSNSTQNK
jgi:hypothetical protein